MAQQFFVPCYDCGNDVLVAFGTYNRWLHGQSWIVCEGCLPTATYCDVQDEITRRGQGRAAAKRTLDAGGPQRSTPSK